MSYLYNLHGALLFKSNEPLTRLTEFKTAYINQAPDIKIQFGPFKPSLEGYRKINEAWVGDNSVYYEGRYKLCLFRVWFRDVEGSTTIINFDGDPFFSREIFYVLILEPFMTKKLCKKGILLLHSASFSLNEEGYLISGLSGTGKTTILLRMLDLKGAKYFSDDQTIVDEGEVLTYPMPIGLRGHLLRSSGITLNTLDTFNVFVGDLINKLTNSYGNLTHRVSPGRIVLPNSKTGILLGITVPLKTVFLLNLNDKSGIHQVGKEEARSLLLEHNKKNEDKQKLMYRFFTNYMEVYPSFSYWKHYESLIASLVASNVTFYRVDLDRKYDEKSYSNMKEIVLNE